MVGDSRQCPGRRMAETNMNVLIVKMLKEFKIEYHEPPITASFNNPSSIKLRFIKRNK